MKIAISGKGGVGKTSFSALLARYFIEEGKKVLVIDADPDANLALTLGFPDIHAITPIADLKNLIYERTQTSPSTSGMFFKLNPHVSDIPDKFCIEHDGIKLMLMGTIHKGGSGCACPENVFLKALLYHLVVERDEIVILDLPAGIEHLGRGTAGFVDILLVIIEATPQSIQTAQKIKLLAGDLKIKRIAGIGNKIRNEEDKNYIIINSPVEILGFISYDDELRGAISSISEMKKKEIEEIARKNI